MPILVLVGLVLSIIKIAMDVALYLKAHPDTPAEMYASLERAHFTLGEVHADLSEWERTHGPEAP